MAINPNLIGDFVNRTNDGLLTNIGGGINQLVTQRRAAEAARIKKENYDAAVAAFNESGDPADIGRIREANPEEFEGWKAAFDTQNEYERNQTIQGNTDMIGFLDAGMADKAVSRARETAEAFRSDNDESNDGAIEMWENFANQIESGDTRSVRNYLMAINSATPEGQKANDAIFAINKDTREDESHIADIIETGINFEYGSPEHEKVVLALAEKMKNPAFATLVAEMGHVVGISDGMTGSQLDNAAQSWRNIYFRETTDWRKALASSDKVQSAGQLAIDTAGGTGTQEVRHPVTGELVTITGPADLALMNAFQRLIDPATVRQGDIDLMRATVGGLEKAEMLVDSFFNGTKLNDNQRVMMMEMADQIMATYANLEGDSRDVVLANTRALNIPDEKVVGKQLLGNWKQEVDDSEEAPTEDKKAPELKEGMVPGKFDPETGTYGAPYYPEGTVEETAVEEEVPVAVADSKYDNMVQSHGGLTQDGLFRAFLLENNTSEEAQTFIKSQPTSALVARFKNGVKSFDNKQKVEAAKLEKSMVEEPES